MAVVWAIAAIAEFFAYGRLAAYEQQRALGTIHRLRSPILRTRQGALQTLVHRWVERRLDQMGLTSEQKQDWARQLEERSRQGNDLLSKLRRTDPWYGGWGYGFCAACRGCTDVCETLKTSKKK